MTEEEAPKITSVVKTPREKNPGRVAARKRLAAISKEAKERKRLERENVIKKSCERSDNTSVVLAVGGLVVKGAAALYFLKFHNTEGERTEGTESPKEPSVARNSKEPKELSVARSSKEPKEPSGNEELE